MRILLFIDSLGSGGAQRQCVTLAKIFEGKGYDVSILCYGKENFFSHELNIKIHWNIENNHILRMFKIRKFIRQGNYDTVISFMDVPNFINCFAAVGGKKWKVFTGERSAKEEKFKSIQGKIFAWFQKFSDKLICNSFNAEKMWLKYYPHYQDKLEVIYNPILLPKITSEYRPKKDGKVHVVIAASYQYLKNPKGLVMAISLMSNDERSKLKIDWYGEKNVSDGGTSAHDEAQKLIIQNNLQEVISFNDTTNEIISKVFAADFIALLSELEGLPNTILEGMSVGKPVIMTRMSDYNNLVNDSNGFLCDWDNSESIKEAFVKAMLMTEDELIEMGINSKRKANELLSKDIILQKWENLIEN